MNDWPRPPLISHLLLENPWPLFCILITIALMCGWYAWQWRRRALLFTTLVILTLAGSLFLLATMVSTTREILTERTRQLVVATAPFDEAALSALLQDRVKLTVAGAPVGLLSSRQGIVDLARRAESRYHFNNHDMGDLNFRIDSPLLASAHLTVHSVTHPSSKQTMGLVDEWPVTTSWVLTWSRADSAQPWRIQSIDWVKLNQQLPTVNQLP